MKLINLHVTIGIININIVLKSNTTLESSNNILLLEKDFIRFCIEIHKLSHPPLSHSLYQQKLVIY